MPHSLPSGLTGPASLTSPNARSGDSANFLARARKAIRVAKTLIMDFRYGGRTGGITDSPYCHLGVGRTESTALSELEYLFEKGWLRIKETDVLVDVGCGRGRVLNYWLSLGLRNRLIGVELNEVIALETRQRLAEFPNVVVITGDILEHIPPNGTIYFAYNPASASILSKLKTALLEASQTPEDLVLVYYVCHHLSVFEDDERWTIQRIQMPSGVEAAIIRQHGAAVGASSRDSRPFIVLWLEQVECLKEPTVRYIESEPLLSGGPT